MKRYLENKFILIGILIGILSLSILFSYNSSRKDNYLVNNEYGSLKVVKLFDDKKVGEFKEDILALKSKGNFFVEKGSKIHGVSVNVLGGSKEGVVVGKGLKDFIYEKDNKRLIKIDKFEYEVEEISKENKYAYTCTLPIELLLENYKDKSIASLNIYMDGQIDFDYIEKTFLAEKYPEMIKSIDLVEEEGMDIGLFVIAITIFIVSFVNVCNFTLAWMENRKREIALYKAVGAKNTSLLIMIFLEQLKFAGEALVAALFLQIIINYFINSKKILNFYMVLNIKNILACGIAVGIISFFCVLPAFIYATTIHPVTVLKEE